MSFLEGEILLKSLMFILFILIVIAIFLLFTSMVQIYKVNSFFRKYGCTEGKVISYSYDEEKEEDSVTLLPNGTNGFFIFPNTEYKDAEFYITLECFNNNCHYYATYKIPEDDFNQYDIESTVKIKSSWEQYDYDVID